MSKSFSDQVDKKLDQDSTKATNELLKLKRGMGLVPKITPE